MKYVIGIDEVGRGPLAGPVVVCAAAIPEGWRIRIMNYELGKLKDSKQLTSRQREDWFKYFKKQPKISYAIARVSPKVIDRINISAKRKYGLSVESIPHTVLTVETNDELRREASFRYCP